MSLEVIKLSSVENNLLIILKEVQVFSWRQITLSVLSSRTFLSRSLISSSSFVLCLMWSWHSSSSCCLSEFAAVMRSITSRRLWDSDYKKEKCFVSVEWLTIFCKRNNIKWQLVKDEVKKIEIKYHNSIQLVYYFYMWKIYLVDKEQFLNS